jgi:hypothetical protein
MAKRTMLGIPSFITKTCWQLGHTILPSTTEIYRYTPPKGLMNQFDVDEHLNDRLIDLPLIKHGAASLKSRVIYLEVLKDQVQFLLDPYYPAIDYQLKIQHQPRCHFYFSNLASGIITRRESEFTSAALFLSALHSIRPKYPLKNSSLNSASTI